MGGFKLFRQMQKPQLYHGKTPWNRFEGWYFKIVNRDTTETFAFIPGVFWGNNQKRSNLSMNF